MEKLKNWSLLVKPTCDCNINCEYCFASAERKKNKDKVMTVELVEHIAKLAGEHAENIQWIWHGGEPTLVGAEWYRKVQTIFYKYFRTKYDQKMQSNGTLIDDSWFELLEDYDIAIGISFDAFNQNTRTSHKYVLEIIKKLEEANGGAGVIAVITSNNYNRMIELYEYFKRNLNCQPAFNQIFTTDPDKNGLRISPEEYKKAFAYFYQYWLFDTSDIARAERTAMSATHHVIGNREHVCTNTDCRLNWLGVSPVGEIYPCDRQFNESYSMGYIQDYASIAEIYESENFRKYYYEVEERFKNHCEPCGYGDYCKGGCNANAVEATGSAAGIDKVYCQIFKQRFDIVYNILRKVDLYRDKINKNLFHLFATHPFFPVLEIKQFLASLGYSTEWDYTPTGKEMLNSTEFKIFRVFNIFKGDKLNGTTNYRNYPVEFCSSDFKSMKQRRNEILMEIYKTEIETIEGLIGKPLRRVVV